MIYLLSGYEKSNARNVEKMTLVFNSIVSLFFEQIDIYVQKKSDYNKTRQKVFWDVICERNFEYLYFYLYTFFQRHISAPTQDNIDQDPEKQLYIIQGFSHKL